MPDKAALLYAGLLHLKSGQQDSRYVEVQLQLRLLLPIFQNICSG